MHVGIIGAGIGGTCLAHGLKKNGIKVTIFERNGDTDNELPGYGIHINVFGQLALKECLPEPNWLKLVDSAKSVGGKMRFYDEQLRLLTDHEGRQYINDKIVSESRLSISRVQLQETLLNGLENNIQWHKEFKNYEVLPDERIRLNFTDSTDCTVDLLIGADASNSKVRKQYLPDYHRISLGITAIAGRTRLTQDLKDTLPSDLYDGSPNSIVPLSSDWMFFSTWHAPVNTDPAVPMELDDYLVWAYILPTNKMPKVVNSEETDALGNLVSTSIREWDQRFYQIVIESDRDSVTAIELQSMGELREWDSSTVTLLGDAIHNMTPMAGVGANTALRDALTLTQQLKAKEKGYITLIEAVRQYEKLMRSYANTSVMLSRKNAENAINPSVWKRRSFRLLLKIAGKIKIVRNMMFSPGR